MKLIDDVVKKKFKNYITPMIQNKKPYSIEPILDKDGLDKAYSKESKLYTHGDTLYIAGTSSLQDVWDDLKIPFRQTDKSMRYKNASALLKVNRDITNVVGHSLGGSVALELQQNFPERNFKTNTYGAPVFSATPAGTATGNRYRNYFDPISFLDRGANSSINIGLNPHTFGNFDQNKVSTKAFTSFTSRTDE
jgi:hypothetical protein